MDERKKTDLRNRLAKYCQRYQSNNMAAASLKNISAATISNILNGKWNIISEDMWKRLESQLVNSWATRSSTAA